MTLWQLVNDEDATVSNKLKEKLEGVSLEERLIFEVVKRYGNQGVWSKDIKGQTPNISAAAFEKHLKKLCSMELIKSFKSVASKHKKMYILAELDPSTSIAGGAWHTDQEFDIDLISIISNYVVNVLERCGNKGLTLAAVTESIAHSKLSVVPLGDSDIEELMEMLVYDGTVSKVEKRNSDGGKDTYWLLRPLITHLDFFTTTPCGICPVFNQCVEGGIVSPATCKYMPSWLAKCSENEKRGEL